MRFSEVVGYPHATAAHARCQVSALVRTVPQVPNASPAKQLYANVAVAVAVVEVEFLPRLTAVV
jgi:hypothetical protein